MGDKSLSREVRTQSAARRARMLSYVLLAALAAVTGVVVYFALNR